MTTQELKQHIDKVLGNNIRCLLPSYWWRRLFSLTLEKVDEKLDATNIKTINGESIVGEGNLKVGVTTVGSIDELNALEAEVGDIATATREAEKFVGVGTLLQYEDGVDYNSLFKVKKVSISVPKTSIGELSLVHLSTREGNITLTIVCSADGKDGYIQAWYEDGRKVDLMREQTLVQSNIDDLNSYLSKNVVRYISAGASSGSHFEFIDTWFKVATPYTVADAYIKSYSWEKLSKEYVVSSEKELNALSVENGTIAKVARELKQINRANCHTVIKFSDIPANWDKFTRVDKVEHIGGNTSSSCGINLAHYDGHAYVVLRINFVGYMTYVASVYVDSTLTNEVSITKTEVDVKLQEYDFRYIGPTFTMGEPYIDSTFALYEKDVSADAYIKGETWTRLLKEGDVTGGGSVIFSIPLSGDITDITENQRNRNIESYQKVIKAFEDNIVLDIKIDQLFISNVSLYVIDVNNNIVAMVFNRDNSVYTYRFSSDGNFTREIEEGSALEIDSELSDTSENAVQNKAIKAYVDNAVANLTNKIIANEEVTAAALNDLSVRINDILTRLNNAGI